MEGEDVKERFRKGALGHKALCKDAELAKRNPRYEMIGIDDGRGWDLQVLERMAHNVKKEAAGKSKRRGHG